LCKIAIFEFLRPLAGQSKIINAAKIMYQDES
jgi:hypothetical protein